MFPEDPRRLVEYGLRFQEQLRQLRQVAAPPDGGWYPYESLSSLTTVAALLRPVFEEVCPPARVLDLGCGDGDYSLLFASLGLEVDAVDNACYNYNGMRGVRQLARECGVSPGIVDADLDSGWPLADREYGLTLFLGLLYHLKNPYQVLEQLAYRTRWCVLSTRVAQVTPGNGSRIEEEPVAYLASGMEINGDATNYWIFSPAGLRRILQRTRWAILGEAHLGCLSDSNPSDPRKDQRMFVLLKSRVFSNGLEALPVEGIYGVEDGTWRWTAKHFVLQVILPLEQHCTGFALDLYVPQAAVERKPVSVTASIGGAVVGSGSRAAEGTLRLTGTLPETTLHRPVLHISFEVDNTGLQSGTDGRDLGLCLPLAEGGRLPFTVY
ncbi:MAG: class I SAM-dependent methyltransferase [Bryobacterales bacterium]|nr:class I SAM-dependent methyltransferase [Bryobacterales bacterium]